MERVERVESIPRRELSFWICLCFFMPISVLSLPISETDPFKDLTLEIVCWTLPLHYEQNRARESSSIETFLARNVLFLSCNHLLLAFCNRIGAFDLQLFVVLTSFWKTTKGMTASLTFFFRLFNLALA